MDGERDKSWTHMAERQGSVSGCLGSGTCSEAEWSTTYGVHTCTGTHGMRSFMLPSYMCT